MGEQEDRFEAAAAMPAEERSKLEAELATVWNDMLGNNLSSSAMRRYFDRSTNIPLTGSLDGDLAEIARREKDRSLTFADLIVNVHMSDRLEHALALVHKLRGYSLNNPEDFFHGRGIPV